MGEVRRRFQAGLPASTPAASLTSVASHTLRRHNVSAILRAILANGPLTRTEIGQLTGLSPGAVTRLTRPMVANRLLVELPSRPGRGRPSVPLELDLSSRAAIGLHIGLEYTRAAFVDLRGNAAGERVLEHHTHDPERVLDDAAKLVDGLRAEAGERTILGISASTGGLVDYEQGVVLENAPLGWRRVPIRDRLSERLGQPVSIDHTARAIALAEVWFGATQADSLVQVFVGNFVGAALVLRRELYRGRESTAGSLTHVPVAGRSERPCTCGRRDCFETVASSLGVLAHGRDQGVVGPREDFESLIDRARSGDKRIDALLRRQARHVGGVCRLLLDILDPEVITLAGRFVQAPEYVDEVRSAADRYERPSSRAAERVRLTSLSEDQLLIGSAALSLSAYYTDPLGFESELAAAVVGSP